MSRLVAQDGALGGFVLFFRWIAGGGLRGQQTGETRFPAPLVFGHFLLAVAGLVVWIVYRAADRDGPAWTSCGILVAVALLGFTLFARWLPVYRATVPAGQDATAPPERQLPIPVVGRRPRPAGRHHPGVRAACAGFRAALLAGRRSHLGGEPSSQPPGGSRNPGHDRRVADSEYQRGEQGGEREVLL
ncbi:hypothetical protein ACFQ7I_06430 [Streptomyces massasporeus]